MTIPPLSQIDAAMQVRPVSPRSSPAGVGGDLPLRLDWVANCATPGRQVAFEVQAAADRAFETGVVSTGPVESSQQLDVEAPGGPLRSREVRFLRVRVATERGWSEWSQQQVVEAGLLSAGDWSAVAVTLPDDPGGHEQSPAPILRREFVLAAAPVRARLYVTSLGVHELRINGVRVGDHLLEPGWSAYQERLLVTTHDVTGLLTSGANVLAGVLGDGWYRGRLAWDPEGDRCRYGEEVGLLAQLEVDLADGTSIIVATDGSWRASTAEIRSADLYDGCLIDLGRRQHGWDQPGFDDLAWPQAVKTPLDLGVLQPQVAPPVRVVETLAPVISAAASGTTRLDAGQNVAGYVRLTVRGSAGDTVTVRHAEVLGPDGSLYTLPLRSAKATDTYILADDETVVLEPVFTFHGFRYAEVATSAEIISAEVLAISSDTASRSSFTCSDPVLTRFHENVRWSQRDNFVAVPTDCPQRDERLGWTGDAQAFAPTACTLFDSRSFWAGWLVDVAVDQTADGAVPSVVPNILGDGEFALGRAGWADAATIVPWSVHASYRDSELLAQQLPSMKALVAYLEARRRPDGLLGGEFQFGDWLDPDAPEGQPHRAKTSGDFLANAFFSYSSRIVGWACDLLGDPAASKYEDLAGDIASLTWTRWRDHAVTTQTGCAAAIELQIAPGEEHPGIGGALAELVRDADGRIATGFLGTPLVLPALSRTGHLSEAYLMLLRRDMPSWLYQVDQGATTVWERWDAILPDGSIHSGRIELPDQGESQMLSFNHYAYGAVIDWVYRNLAGLAPDPVRPGYEHVVLAPKPVRGIDWVRASVETGFGTISAEWRTTEDTFAARYVLPFGVTATFVPPLGGSGNFTADGTTHTGEISLGPGKHEVTVPYAAIVSPAVASIR